MYIKVKKVIIVWLTILISLTFLACQKQNNILKEKQRETPTIKIGLIGPLSGDVAQYGTWMKYGAELAAEEINQQGKIQIELIYEDDRCDSQTAVNAVNNLINNYKTPIIIGSWCSSPTLSIAPITESHKIILMADAMSPKISQAGDYVFRFIPSLKPEVKFLNSFITTHYQYTQGALLYIENDYGIAFKDYFKQLFTNEKRQLIAQNYLDQTTDFRSILSKLKTSQSKFLIIAGYDEIGLILKQARELDLDIPIFATNTAENPNLIQTAGQAAEGLLYTYYFDVTSQNPILHTYQQKYQSRYAELPEITSSNNYDALKILAPILERCGSNTDCIKGGLYQTKNFSGVVGNYTFDEYGDVEMDFIMKTVKDGQFVKYKQ